MLAAERQSKILQIVEAQGSVQVDALADEMNVSAMTIRRDLEKLHDNNMLERCHGGAVAKQEITYADKQTSHKNEKERIASACAERVQSGDVVFLDAGTTTYEIARRIKEIPGIMVVTSDLEIARYLQDSDVELAVCGGTVQNSTGSMFGYHAIQMIKCLRFDVAFFGAASINEEFEVLTPTIDKAFLKRETARRCEALYLAADRSKFNRQAMNLINNLGDYTGIVTDRVFDAAEKEKLTALGAKIIQV